MLDGSSIEAMRERLPHVIKDGIKKIIVPQFELISLSEKYSKHSNRDGFGRGAVDVEEEDEFDSPILEEVYPCDCRFDPDVPMDRKACGINSACINRTLMIECSPTECPTRDNCQNQKIRKQEFANIEVFETPGKGFGIRCLEDLAQGTMIMEYVGEIISQKETDKRIIKYSKRGMSHFYFMTLRPDMIIDATNKGNLSRFMNHSCAPNCATQKWIVDGRMRIALCAEKKIPRLQELTFDYKAVRVGSKPQVCLCGEACCKGFIGAEPKDVNSDGNEDGNEDEDDESISTSSSSSSSKEDQFSSLDRFKHDEGIIKMDDLMDVYKALLKISDSKEPLLGNLISSLTASIKKDPLLGGKFTKDLHGYQLMSFLIGSNMRNHSVLERCIDLLLVLPPSPDHRLNEKVVNISKFKSVIPDEIIKKSLSVSFEENSFKIPKNSSDIRGVSSEFGFGGKDYNNTNSNTNTSTISTPPPLPQPPPLPDQLPPNWKIAFAPSDPNNPSSLKIPYYYHSITKEVSWKKPAVAFESTNNNRSSSFSHEYSHNVNNQLLTTHVQVRRVTDKMVHSLLLNRPPLPPSLRQRLHQSVWDKESKALRSIETSSLTLPPQNLHHKQMGRIRNFILHYLSEHGIRIRDGN